MRYLIIMLITGYMYAQCEHVKPAEVEYIGVQTSEIISNDTINCIIFTRQAERFTCPKCLEIVNIESRKDTVVFWRKEE